MKILFLASNPRSTSRLNLGKEVQEIEEGLRRSKLSDQFQLVQRWEVRPRDLRRALLEENPDIVHFSGHGRGKAGLVFVDNSGQPKPATGQALAGLFRQFPKLKCVLLNACYAEVQAKVIVQHINYVIGMKDTILDEAAIAFTTGFYDGLGYGRNIEDAFAFGVNAIMWELGTFSDRTRQMIPVNFVRAESQESLPEHLKPILLKKAVNVAQNIKTQSIKNDSLGIDQNPLQKYRERIKEYLAERILSPIAKFQLATLAKQLDISESEANNILQAELEQIERAKENYRTLLRQTIEQGYDLSNPAIQQQLKELQTSLKLIDSEVAEISKAIFEPAEADEREKQPREQEKDEQQQRGSQSEQNLPTIKLEKFLFEVITVDNRGEENIRITKEAEFFRENLANGVTLEMVKIPSGKFLMGSPEGEGNDNERPQHEVTVKPFLMGKYQVTQAQWKAVMDNNPSYFKGDNRPVENVSWYNAVEFCAPRSGSLRDRLSKLTGREYRLPSEAEWEYACRAGTKTPFYFGSKLTPKLARYEAKETANVGQFFPNGFGLYDMHGNVWEWCADHWHGNYRGSPIDGAAWLSSDNTSTRVIRGGSYYSTPNNCRSASRDADVARGDRFNYRGFRVVGVLPRT